MWTVYFQLGLANPYISFTIHYLLLQDFPTLSGYFDCSCVKQQMHIAGALEVTIADWACAQGLQFDYEILHTYSDTMRNLPCLFFSSPVCLGE